MDLCRGASTLSHVSRLVLGVWITLVAVRAFSQGTRADYQRAAELHRLTENRVFRTHVRANWTADGKQFWYRIDTGPGQYEFVHFDTEKPGRHAAFDHQRLAAAMNKAGWNRVGTDRLPIYDLEFDPAGRHFDFRSTGKWWRCKLPDYDLFPRPAGGASTSGKGSPAGESLQPVADAPKASTHTGPETIVTFVNQTLGEVELIWLDPEGRRHGYGKLGPGDEHDQPTFAGHVWLLLNHKGQPLGVYEAAAKPVTVEITASPSHAQRGHAAAADHARGTRSR